MEKTIKNLTNQQTLNLNDNNQLVIGKFYYLEIQDQSNNKLIDKFEIISETENTNHILTKILNGPVLTESKLSLGMKSFFGQL